MAESGQAGLPQVITIGGVDRSNTGVGYDRPIATGSGKDYLSNPTPSRWYDPAAFVEAPSGSWGNVGRNTLIGPGILALDFDLHKEFRMPGAAFPGQPSTNAHQGFGTITGTQSQCGRCSWR